MQRYCHQKFLLFLIAMDISTNRGLSYLTMRTRFQFKNHLHNIHILAVSVFEKRTPVIILVVMLLFSIVSVLPREIIYIETGSKGVSMMNERISGVVTKL